MEFADFTRQGESLNAREPVNVTSRGNFCSKISSGVYKSGPHKAEFLLRKRLGTMRPSLTASF